MTILREERIGGQRLILGDCFRVLPKHIGFTAMQFDLLLTDPPYGIGRDGKPKSTSKHGGHKGYEHKGWDSRPPTDAQMAIFIAGAKDAMIWGANYFPKSLPPSSGWLVWDKGQRIDQADGELAFTTRSGALRVFTLNRVALMKDGAVHPTQKPVALMEWCLGFLPDAKTILDPFMGSGTTLVACQRMGRHGTGIELDPDYFAIACKRVDEAARQPDLLIPETRPQPVQEQLL